MYHIQGKRVNYQFLKLPRPTMGELRVKIISKPVLPKSTKVADACFVSDLQPGCKVMHSSCALEYGNVVLTGEGGGLSTHHLDFPLWRKAVWLRKELRQHQSHIQLVLGSTHFGKESQWQLEKTNLNRNQGRWKIELPGGWKYISICLDADISSATAMQTNSKKLGFPQEEKERNYLTFCI